MTRSFSALRNPDGSVCAFRVVCLLVIALCLLAAGVLQLLHNKKPVPEAPRSVAPAAAPQPQKKPEEPQSGKHALAEPLKLRALAFAELDEAAAFFEDCGSINKGFAGCNFAFSDEVSRYYEGIAQAADDGFAVTLKAREGNPDRERCEVLELDSSGARRALDSQGKMTDGCWPEDNPDVASASGAAAAPGPRS
ncbi:MAG: hypothetical protein SPL30_05205 [Succinivibrio sp.]|nr:hypothetical protein [Succinivibrio sp.]